MGVVVGCEAVEAGEEEGGALEGGEEVGVR